MHERLHTIEWDAHPHLPRTRGDDWYWVLGIVAVSSAIAAIILGNVLFGIVIILGMLVMMIYAQTETHEPIPYAITPTGISIGSTTYPYSKIESFWIDREHHIGPHLLVNRTEGIEHILVIPLPDEYVDDIHELLGMYLPEEYTKEPLAHQLLALVGF